jgi:hypothetical protein
VLPLLPSRTIGNVGGKHRSEATQLGQILSQIDAYSGFRAIQEGCKTREKRMVAGINNDWLRKRSPQVTMCGTFKDVFAEEKLNAVRRIRTQPGKGY